MAQVATAVLRPMEALRMAERAALVAQQHAVRRPAVAIELVLRHTGM